MSDKRGGKGKRWCFTSFDTAEPKFKDGCTLYYCFGRETCPTTSKMHWQGFVVFLNRQRISSAKKLGGHSWHYEAARGTVAENIGYCSKDGVFTEVGTRPPETSEGGAQSTKRKWIDIRDNARRGNFDAIEAKVYVQHCRNLHFISDVASQRSLVEVSSLEPLLDSGSSESPVWANPPSPVGWLDYAAQHPWIWDQIPHRTNWEMQEICTIASLVQNGGMDTPMSESSY